MAKQQVATFSGCFRETYRLRNILPEYHTLQRLTELELEFDGDRQKLLDAGTIFDLTYLVSQAIAVWVSPSVFLMSGDNHDEIFRHTNDPIPADSLTVKLSITLTVRPRVNTSKSHCSSLRFLLYWERASLLNESIQYAVEILLALCHDVAVETFSFTGIDETYRVAETSFEPLDAMTLEAFLLRQGPTLEKIDITSCQLSQESCQFIGDSSCKNLFLKVFACSLVDIGAIVAGCVVGRGPKRIALSMPTQDINPLGNLAPNNHIECLEFEYMKSASTVEPRDMQLFVVLLELCRSLKEFRWNFTRISDEAWKVLFESICNHPSLKKLYVRGACGLIDEEGRQRRTRIVLECLRRNASLDSIFMSPQERDEDMWRDLVMPLLHLNAFRRQLQTLDRDAEAVVSRALLGKVLLNVNHSPNLTLLCLVEHSGSLFGQ